MVDYLGINQSINQSITYTCPRLLQHLSSTVKIRNEEHEQLDAINFNLGEFLSSLVSILSGFLCSKYLGYWPNCSSRVL